MTDYPTNPIVRTFMTHTMGNVDICALSTGRDEEFRRIRAAIDRSATAAPATLQHVVLYGSRGFGKSFMTRRVQIALAERDPAAPPIRYLLMPEEQHNLERSPHAFLDSIALRLETLQSDGDEGYEAALFQWPNPAEDARRWDAAVARLDAAAAAALPDGRGLVVAVVENLDLLLATLFKPAEAEQRLRAWLDRPNNRIMLFGTATGTVDIDYDRPLFHAFEAVRLPPWTADDCLTYFARVRRLEDRSPLSAAQAAKARAVAEFIGGTPRLAQLLAGVLDTQDALTVAETMSALADKLAEYYRRRIEDLPPLARGLLDALIRGGEPASQTELAARVGAAGQSDIARVMADLQRADIVRGRPAPDSREHLYSATDRMFVHYYRLRQGSRAALATPLTTILDFLRSFYSRDEQRAQALGHLTAGRPAEAAVFSRLAQEGETPRGDFPLWSAQYLREMVAELPTALSADVSAILQHLDEAPETLHERCRMAASASPADLAVVALVRAQALHRMGLDSAARQTLLDAAPMVADDHAARTIVACGTVHFLSAVDWESAAGAAKVEMLQSVPPGAMPPRLAASRLRLLAWSALVQNAPGDALHALDQAANLAAEIGDKWQQAAAMGQKTFALNELRRHDEALNAADQAANLAAEAGDTRGQAEAMGYKASILNGLRRYDETLNAADQAADLAAKIGDTHTQALAMRRKAFALYGLNRHDDVLDVAEKAVAFSAAANDEGEQAEGLRRLALSLRELGRLEEAWQHIAECIDLARRDGELWVLSRAIAHAVELATRLPRRCVTALFAEWLALGQNPDGAADIIDAQSQLGDLFLAAARARVFQDLDRLLADHDTSLVEGGVPFWLLDRHGACLADIAVAEGRAAAYEAITGLLPRIAALQRRLPPERRDPAWLVDLMTGFAAACRDPGLLRDVADLLSDDLVGDVAPPVGDTAALLRLLAAVDEADVAETVLARTDPDAATLVRRLRDLPDPAPPPAKRKVKRARKMPG